MLRFSRSEGYQAKLLSCCFRLIQHPSFNFFIVETFISQTYFFCCLFLWLLDSFKFVPSFSKLFWIRLKEGIVSHSSNQFIQCFCFVLKLRWVSFGKSIYLEACGLFCKGLHCVFSLTKIQLNSGNSLRKPRLIPTVSGTRVRLLSHWRSSWNFPVVWRHRSELALTTITNISRNVGILLPKIQINHLESSVASSRSSWCKSRGRCSGENYSSSNLHCQLFQFA
mmetsp:Transcript_1970/g.2761  ORF Transcript_1970/g.2761 Transcript_1970/m.2761 type:complete len:224 (+) Transcript_1970:91-762(+)